MDIPTFLNPTGDLCVYKEDVPVGKYTARGLGPVGVRIYGTIEVYPDGKWWSTVTNTGNTKAARSEYQLDEIQIPGAIPFTPGQWALIRHKPAA